jgi:hypothetical protein
LLRVVERAEEEGFEARGVESILFGAVLLVVVPEHAQVVAPLVEAEPALAL